MTAVYGNVSRLIEYLTNNTDFLKSEGIFRKNGNVARQRELRRRVLTCDSLKFPLELNQPAIQAAPSSSAKKPRVGTRRTRATAVEDGPLFEASAYNVHDYAATLKSVLHEMPVPILTRELLPIFDLVAELTSDHENEEGERTPLSPEELHVAQAKQLKAIRLLRFLLPKKNQSLLRSFLDLLTETLKYSEENRMTASSLGTLFGPLILATSEVSFLQHDPFFLVCLF